MKILIAEDEEDLGELFAELLNKNFPEHEVVTVGDGIAAMVEFASKEVPRLAILDWNMPGLSGPQVCKKVREDSDLLSTFVILLTGRTEDRDLVEGLDAGANDYLTKPISQTAFIARIRVVLDVIKLNDQVIDAKERLEQKNISLMASFRKLEELHNSRDLIFKRLEQLHLVNLKTMETSLDSLYEHVDEKLKGTVSELQRESGNIVELLRPITSSYVSEVSLRDKLVLLTESNPIKKNIAKIALGGTGVKLDVATNLEEGAKQVSEKSYDIICVNSEMLDLARAASEKNPDVKMVFLTKDDLPESLPRLKQYPYLSNIISWSEEEGAFAVKSISTTISKMINKDFFGMEKYLSWGAEITERRVTGSLDRPALLEELVDHLETLGIRPGVLRRIESVSEEMLMNAIYDAPVGEDGEPLYNHLSRAVTVDLEPKHQALFRYASDGLMVAVSVEDPFGALNRQTVLEYLEKCYSGNIPFESKDKGGGGAGLFTMFERSDLVVFNISPDEKTEVLCLFNISLTKTVSSRIKNPSFHIFQT